MNIPDEAVEAAAKAFFGTLALWAWEDQGPRTQEGYRDKARAALEAAAPYLLAQGWDEGEQAGAMNHAAEEYPEVKTIPNPYRSQA